MPMMPPDAGTCRRAGASTVDIEDYQDKPDPRSLDERIFFGMWMTPLAFMSIALVLLLWAVLNG